MIVWTLLKLPISEIYEMFASIYFVCVCVSTRSQNHWQLYMNQCNVSLCIGHALVAVDEDLGVGIVDETSSPRKTMCKHSSTE